MASPITGSSFDNQSFSGSVCSLFRQKLLSNDKMKLLLEYLFDDDGNIQTTFATDLLGLCQPIGSLMQAPIDINPDANEWVLCDGRAINRTTYARLFSLIGTTFGSGDGSSTFNVPNYKDLFLLSSGDSYSVGSSGGSATHTLTEAEIPAHTHSFSATFARAGSDSGTGSVDSGGSSTTVDSALEPLHLSVTIGSTGGGAAHNNMPPYKTVKTYIKANFVINGNIL